MQSAIVSIKEAAALIGMSPATVRRLVAEGSLRDWSLPGRNKTQGVYRAEVEALIAQDRQPAATRPLGQVSRKART